MNFKKLLILVIFAIAIVGIIAPLNATSIDKSVKIESKAKTASYKVTWNGNGGKIGTQKTKVTIVKKDTKIGKLPTPKRTGYTFQGWYTKKTGGTKISKNTIVKKKITYYTHWKKGSSNTDSNSGGVLTADDNKLVGTWKSYYFGDTYTFSANGKFMYFDKWGNLKTGNFKASGRKITFTNIVAKLAGEKCAYPKTQIAEYKIEKITGVLTEYLVIRALNFPDLDYLPFSNHNSYANMGY